MIIQPKINPAKKLKGGKCTIRIYIFDPIRKEQRTPSTEHRIDPAYWVDGQVHKSHPNHAYINSSLKKKCVELESKYLKNPQITIDELLQESEVKPAGKTTLSDYMEQYRALLDTGKILSKKGQPLSPDYIESLNVSMNVVDRFFSELGTRDFEGINEEFYSEFVTWMRFEEEFAENTIGKVIKALKRVMKAARKARLHDSIDYEYFAVPDMETFAIALSEAEIESMLAAQLPDHLRVEMDRWYVAYNFLLRFTDSIEIDKRDIIKEKGIRYLKTTPNKTWDEVIIPLKPKTYEILKKYDFKLPKTTNQESNWKIKEVGRLAGITEPTTITEIKKGKPVKRVEPRHDLITTHTARRSMATNLWNSGFDLKQIQLMGGWKTLTSLQRYLRIEKMENARKAAEHPFFN